MQVRTRKKKDKLSKREDSSEGVRPLLPVVRVLQKARLQRDVMRLVEQGLCHEAIASALQIEKRAVSRYIAAGLEEYYAERDEAVHRYLAIANARYARLLREWIPRAEARIEVIENENGERIEVEHPGDPEAARIVLTAQRDAARMMGLNKIRVEHTGRDGGSIAVDVDWTKLPEDVIEKFKVSGDPGILQAFISAASGAR